MTARRAFDRAAAHAHVLALADAAGVQRTDVARSGRARATRRTRAVAIPEIRSLRSYLVALHELGHVIGANPRLRLDQEVAAWNWALAHTRFEPTDACWRMIGRALGSYVARAVRRPGMRVPEPGHPIWPFVPIDHGEVVALAKRTDNRLEAALDVWRLVQERSRGEGSQSSGRPRRRSASTELISAPRMITSPLR